MHNYKLLNKQLEDAMHHFTKTAIAQVLDDQVTKEDALEVFATLKEVAILFQNYALCPKETLNAIKHEGLDKEFKKQRRIN